jgi:tetratricopeptide (TPR) repeat protein
MKSKARVKIISASPSEFSTNINVDNVVYHVQTEDMGTKTAKITSRVFLKGEVVFSGESDYSHLLQLKNFKDSLKALIEDHHKSTIDIFLKEQAKKQKLKSEYFEEAQKLLRRGSGKRALNTLEQALEKFPGDPFLLSYYGCLVAIVKKAPTEGIEICKNAIERLDETMPFGRESVYPVFYLNLGRAYLKDSNRKEAVAAFKEGLRNDPENRDLLWELRKLGTRRRAPIPFIRRSNPINKYIGKLLDRIVR